MGNDQLILKRFSVLIKWLRISFYLIHFKLKTNSGGPTAPIKPRFDICFTDICVSLLFAGCVRHLHVCPSILVMPIECPRMSIPIRTCVREYLVSQYILPTDKFLLHIKILTYVILSSIIFFTQV